MLQALKEAEYCGNLAHHHSAAEAALNVCSATACQTKEEKYNQAYRGASGFLRGGVEGVHHFHSKTLTFAWLPSSIILE